MKKDTERKVRKETWWQTLGKNYILKKLYNMKIIDWPISMITKKLNIIFSETKVQS